MLLKISIIMLPLFVFVLFTPVFSLNPFAGKELYVPHRFQSQVLAAMRTSSEENRKMIAPLLNVSTALWIDKMKISNPSLIDKETFLSALTDASTKSPVPLVTSIIYDLPNRDCGAASSAGEICCLKRANGTCDMTYNRECNGGTAEYRHSYIDVIANTVHKFCDIVPMAFIIEPDSLPNLITNLENPNCGSNSTLISYRTSIPYAIQKLKTSCPSVSIYLDAAHGSWLGWEDNADGYVEEVKKMNIAHLLRGFSVNVANYIPLGTKCPSVGFCIDESPDHPCCQPDPCDLTSSGNPGFTMLNYVEELFMKFTEAIKGFTPFFIIDTARNGKNIDQCWGTWCNFRDAGIGIKSTPNTDNEIVDAFFWVKPPTESDGCTKILPGGQNQMCPRFDPACAHEDSVGSMQGEPRAPEAGDLFTYQFTQLVKNGIQ